MYKLTKKEFLLKAKQALSNYHNAFAVSIDSVHYDIDAHNCSTRETIVSIDAMDWRKVNVYLVG